MTIQQQTVEPVRKRKLKAPPTRSRVLAPVIEVSEVIKVVAGVYGVRPFDVTHPNNGSQTANEARSAALLICRDYGHTVALLSRHFTKDDSRKVSRLIAKLVAEPTADLFVAKDAVTEYIVAQQVAKFKQTEAYTRANQVRNDEIKRLRARGWSIRGLANRFEISGEEVCDVVGEDRSQGRYV